MTAQSDEDNVSKCTICKKDLESELEFKHKICWMCSCLYEIGQSESN